MKKTYAAVLLATLGGASLLLLDAACSDDPVPSTNLAPEAGPPPNGVEAGTDAGTDAAVTCRPGERAITLVNNCGSTDLWVGWAGNDGTAGCQTTAECPSGSTCDRTTKTCTSVASSNCRSAADCPGVNQFCNTGVPSYAQRNCAEQKDCNATEFCDRASPAGYFFSAADGGDVQCQLDAGTDDDAGPANQQPDPECEAAVEAGAALPARSATGVFCDRTTMGRHRCAFHQCGTNKCYFAPVPIADIPAGATRCTKPSDCTDPGQFCYVPQGNPLNAPLAEGSCVAIPSAGANGQQLTHATNPTGTHQVTLCVPTPWAGRFWPRTGCTQVGDGGLTCQTGSCNGQKAGGGFAESCAQPGTDSPTLAEFYFPPYGAGLNGAPGSPDDFYDVSLVDGVTVPVQITPDNYDPKAGRTEPAEPCTPANDTCASKHDIGWACHPIDKVCVNKFECASPGCVSNCGSYGNGAALGAGEACKWTGDLGLSEADCPAPLAQHASGDGGAYIGCLSPKDFCAAAANASNPICTTPGNKDLFGCSGATASVSCYSDTATSTCCGCPTWMPEGGVGGCQAYNPQWEQQAGAPFYDKFHAACPTAYTFPFDDKSATFTCRAKSAVSNVNYTITFCPK